MLFIVAAAERGPEMTAALLAADVLLFLKELLCQTYCYHWGIERINCCVITRKFGIAVAAHNFCC